MNFSPCYCWWEESCWSFLGLRLFLGVFFIIGLLVNCYSWGLFIRKRNWAEYYFIIFIIINGYRRICCGDCFLIDYGYVGVGGIF